MSSFATRPTSDRGATVVYRRTAGEQDAPSAHGGWKSASVSPLQLQAADGYDLVWTQDPRTFRANFRSSRRPSNRRFGDHPNARVGAHGFSSTVSINGTPVAIDTFMVSADGRTPTHAGGVVGQRRTNTVVYERQR